MFTAPQVDVPGDDAADVVGGYALHNPSVETGLLRREGLQDKGAVRQDLSHAGHIVQGVAKSTRVKLQKQRTAAFYHAGSRRTEGHVTPTDRRRRVAVSLSGESKENSTTLHNVQKLGRVRVEKATLREVKEEAQALFEHRLGFLIESTKVTVDHTLPRIRRRQHLVQLALLKSSMRYRLYYYVGYKLNSCCKKRLTRHLCVVNKINYGIL